MNSLKHGGIHSAASSGAATTPNQHAPDDKLTSDDAQANLEPGGGTPREPRRLTGQRIIESVLVPVLTKLLVVGIFWAVLWTITVTFGPTFAHGLAVSINEELPKSQRMNIESASKAYYAICVFLAVGLGVQGAVSIVGKTKVEKARTWLMSPLQAKDVSELLVDEDWKENNKLSLERLLFFSDAVFAIAITVISLDIRPAIPDSTAISAATANSALLSTVNSYIGGFAIIAVTWAWHHRVFSRHIKAFDYGLLWRNMFLLLNIGFMPFIVRFYDSPPIYSSLSYMLSLALITLSGLWIWAYASKRPNLVYQTFSGPVIARTIGTVVVMWILLIVWLLSALALGTHGGAPVFLQLPGIRLAAPLSIAFLATTIRASITGLKTGRRILWHVGECVLWVFGISGAIETVGTDDLSVAIITIATLVFAILITRVPKPPHSKAKPQRPQESVEQASQSLEPSVRQLEQSVRQLEELLRQLEQSNCALNERIKSLVDAEQRQD